MIESENILLQRFAQTGDTEAFSKIVNIYAAMVYSACRRILSDREAAADATQETFFQLLKNPKSIKGSIAGWLHKVATNKSIDIIRKDKSRRERELKYSESNTIQTEKWEDVSPHVDEALDELEDEFRDILIKHFFEGLSMSDIATDSGVSQATISRKVDEGISRLRGKLQKRGIIITGITLPILIAQNIVEAAPAAVMTELGKMTLAGSAAITSTTAATAAGTTASAGTAATTTATTAAAATTIGIKAQILTAAAAVVIATGSVVTYKQVTKPSAPSRSIKTTQQQERDTAASQTPTTAQMNHNNATSVNPPDGGNYPKTITDSIANSTETAETKKAENDNLMTPATPVPTNRVAARVPAAASVSEDPNSTDKRTTTTRSYGGMMGGGMGGGMGGAYFGGARTITTAPAGGGATTRTTASRRRTAPTNNQE